MIIMYVYMYVCIYIYTYVKPVDHNQTLKQTGKNANIKPNKWTLLITLQGAAGPARSPNSSTNHHAFGSRAFADVVLISFQIIPTHSYQITAAWKYKSHKTSQKRHHEAQSASSSSGGWFMAFSRSKSCHLSILPCHSIHPQMKGAGGT